MNDPYNQILGLMREEGAFHNEPPFFIGEVISPLPNLKIRVNNIDLDKHNLKKGYDYFDPDYYMAESLRRLRANDNVQEHDKILVFHEALEYDIMKENPNMSYDEAHELASKTYNYSKALIEWLEKEGG